MQDQQSLVEYNNRLIAFLDILGFSTELETRDMRDLHRHYSQLIDRANAHLFDNSAHGVAGNFARAQFLFDSVLLVSHPLDDGHATESTFNFLGAAALLLEWSLEGKLPLRGAIGVGSLLEDPERNISLSAIVPSLLKEEREPQWSGVTILPTAADAVLRNLYGERMFPGKEGSSIVLKYDVPTKTGTINRWCLNWVHMCDLPDIDAGIAHLHEPKKTNTEAFVRHAESLPAFEADLPEKFRPIAKVRVFAAMDQGGPKMVRVKFIGVDGRGVDPASGVSFDWDGKTLKIEVGTGEPANPALNPTGLRPAG